MLIYVFINIYLFTYLFIYYSLCIYLFVYLLIIYYLLYLTFVLLLLFFSEFQQKKKKLSELYLASGSSESKSSAAQRIVGFLDSLTSILNPDANFVPQERIKALKVICRYETIWPDLSLLGCSFVCMKLYGQIYLCYG